MNWLSFSVETVATIAESIVALNSIAKMVGSKYSGKKQFCYLGISIFLLVSLIVIFNYFSLFSFLTIVFVLIFAVIFSKVFSGCKTIFGAAVTVLTYLVIHSIDYLLLFIFGILFEAPITDLYTFTQLFSFTPLRCCYLLVNKSIDFALYFLFRKSFSRMRQLQSKHYALLLITSAVAYVTMTALLTMVLSDSIATMQTAILFSWIFIVICVFMVITILCMSTNYQREKEANALLHTSNSLMEENYSRLHIAQNESNKRNHDFNHHIELIYELALQGNVKKIAAYTETLLSHVHKENLMCHSGNDIIDAVINSKLTEAKFAQIHFNFRINLPTKVNIEPIDICAILANQIDNAFDACKLIDNVDNRRTVVHIWQKADNIVISQVRNSVMSNPFVSNKNLVSTKLDKTRPHGLGIRSIRETAEKYNGTLDNTYQDGCFISTVLLCYAPDDDS